MYEGVVQDLIDELGRLPGVGPKSAQRIAFHLLAADPADVRRLVHALTEVKDKVRFCAICGNVAESERCRICLDARRDPAVICVVEESKDVVAIERTREFRGRYHVLGGAISPIEGVGPDDLRIRELMTRLADGTVTELILATDPNLEGEATATYLARLCKPMGLKVTRLASGLPVGGDLEYADEVTLGGPSRGDDCSMSDDLNDFTTEIADQIGSFVLAVTEVARADEPEHAVSLLLLEVSQLLLAGGRLGAIADVVPDERFEPDAGPDPDVDQLRSALARLLEPIDVYYEVFDPYLPKARPVAARISDDVADVVADLAHGLAHHRAGRSAEALWWWQFSYLSNWGATASAVLRALLSVVAHARLDAPGDGTTPAEEALADELVEELEEELDDAVVLGAPIPPAAP